MILTPEMIEALRDAITDEVFDTAERLGLSSHQKCVLATRVMRAAEKALTEGVRP